eukprot:9479647-Pyramimonas_sp.AAC.2
MTSAGTARSTSRKFSACVPVLASTTITSFGGSSGCEHGSHRSRSSSGSSSSSSSSSSSRRRRR